MKYILGIALFCWLACGVAGAKMQGDLDLAHWKMVLKGGFTLNDALTDHPVTLTGAD